MEASLWTRCMGALETELPQQQFNTWVRPLQAMEGNGALKLLAPNRFVVEWINANLLPRIGELLRDESTGDAPIVTVEVGSRATHSRKANRNRSVVAPGVSATMRRARRWAHSTNIVSLSRVNACSGVFDRSRRTQHTLESGASKVISIGNGLVRWNQMYIPRR